MGKEKVERVKALEEKFLSIVEEQVSGDLAKVNAHELGEVVDMMKDCAEFLRNCSESKYYCKVIYAMENATDTEVATRLSQYVPETQSVFSTMSSDNSLMGESGKARAEFMEVLESNTTDDATRQREMENYVQALTDDVMEMVSKMPTADKTMLKQRIAILSSKIV